MTSRPVIFISATSDIRSARDLVGKVLYSMGYEPVWQDIEPTDGGELLEVLRRRIAPCAMMVQLVGQRYGAEPPQPTAEFGRVSYTQFEALEAERAGKKVIYHFLDETFPTDPAASEPPELTSLQTAYRQRLKDANRLRHGGIASPTDLELSIRRLSDDLAALHREVTKPPAILSRVEAPRIQVTYETQHPLSAEIDNPPSPVDENVQFTVYRPHAIKPGRWETLLAFAHLSERRPGDEDQPHPLDELERQARVALGDKRDSYDARTQDSSAGIPRGGLITFVPDVAGVEFNPACCAFKWLESVHREEFRLRAAEPADRQMLRGKMSVFLGALLVADITLMLRVDSGAPASAPNAASASEETVEIKDLKHGVLTYALLAGLKAVDEGPLTEKSVQPNNPERVVGVLDWFSFASGEVPRLTKRFTGQEQEVQMRSEGTSFPVLPLEGNYAAPLR